MRSLLLSLLCLLTIPVQGLSSIVFHDVSPDRDFFPPTLGASTGELIDINSDGTPDFRLSANLNIFTIQTSTNAVLVLDNGGSSVGALTFGQVIGPTSPPGFAFLVTGLSGIILNQSDGTGIPNPTVSGEFVMTYGFVGLQFDISGNTHYGWLEIDATAMGDPVQQPGVPVAGGILRSWAYESQPDTPIAAGAVPEPSSSLMLLLAGGSLQFLRSRRKVSNGVRF